MRCVDDGGLLFNKFSVLWGSGTKCKAAERGLVCKSGWKRNIKWGPRKIVYIWRCINSFLKRVGSKYCARGRSSWKRYWGVFGNSLYCGSVWGAFTLNMYWEHLSKTGWAGNLRRGSSSTWSLNPLARRISPSIFLRRSSYLRFLLAACAMDNSWSICRLRSIWWLSGEGKSWKWSTESLYLATDFPPLVIILVLVVVVDWLFVWPTRFIAAWLHSVGRIYCTNEGLC